MMSDVSLVSALVSVVSVVSMASQVYGVFLVSMVCESPQCEFIPLATLGTPDATATIS